MQRDTKKIKEREPPVLHGRTEALEIEAIGEKGDGIAKKNGYVIMIPRTQIGKKYLIRITRIFKNYAIGEVIREIKSWKKEPKEEKE